MKKLVISILPGIGLKTIRFGDSRQDVEFQLGQPDERDEIEGEEENMINPALVYHYWDHYLSIFFGGEKQDSVVAFETDQLDCELFDQKIFKLSAKELVELLKGKKVFEIEEDTEPWGETRLTSAELGIDFYYEGKQLETVNWSAWYDQQGQMVFPDAI